MLSAKPVVYLVNLSEKDYIRKKNKHLSKIAEWMKEHAAGDPILPLSVCFEERLTQFETDEEALEDYDAKDEDTVKTIKELLDTRVRPAVANDGGDIVFRGFKDGIVFLHMRGACSGCPSSTATLRHGIENLLRHFCPDVQEVRPI